MRAIVQRVKNASVTVDNIVTGSIDNGILVYVGFATDDTEKDIKWMLNKLPSLRIFNDGDDKMNLSVTDMGFSILVISQFTLLGSCKKGRRPSFGGAATPDNARIMYRNFLDSLKGCGLSVESGVFQAHMDVSYTNDGPITLIVDSKE